MDFHASCLRAGLLGLALAAACAAQSHELAFTLGGIPSLSRSGGGSNVNLGSGLALEVNYAHVLINGGAVALYTETNILASPLRGISSNLSAVVKDVASLYLTQGIRLKFLPAAKLSPYVAAGAGLAWYEHSTKLINGFPNTLGRESFTGAFNIGAGVDWRVWRIFALRGEVRDFYTGSPRYNIAAISGGQNNVVVGAGFVARWP
jgi:opacity protein-like surface antigen